ARRDRDQSQKRTGAHAVGTRGIATAGLSGGALGAGAGGVGRWGELAAAQSAGRHLSPSGQLRPRVRRIPLSNRKRESSRQPSAASSGRSAGESGQRQRGSGGLEQVFGRIAPPPHGG